MTPRYRHLAVYGLPALPLAALGIPVHVHLPTFYAEQMGLGLAATGLALLAARLFDAVADPLLGYFSDHRRQRRKLWLAASVPVLAVSGWHLFLPADGASPLYLALWSGLFHLGLTLALIAYQAWGTELSADYHQRSRVAGWREAFALIGVVAAIALPALLAWEQGDTLSGLFPPFMLLLAVAVAVALLVVPEMPRAATVDAATWAPLLANRPFHRLLAAQSVNAMANALPATLFLLYVGDRLGRPDMAGLLLVLYLSAAVISMAPWLALARRWGKHRAWAASLSFTALAFLPAVALGPGDWPVFAVLCLLTGFGLGADLALPASMLADVTDEHQAAGGKAQAGLYVALWSLAAKLALAAAVGLAFPLLDFAGFIPGSGQAPLALPLLYAGLPVGLKLAAAAMIHRFPLDHARQLELRRRIALMSETAP